MVLGSVSAMIITIIVQVISLVRNAMTTAGHVQGFWLMSDLVATLNERRIQPHVLLDVLQGTCLVITKITWKIITHVH